MRSGVKNLCRGAIIAALYVVLTVISQSLGLASGAIQLRISEGLCVLPAFTKSAVPGLFIGCLIANIALGGSPWGIIFGSLATLIGAIGARIFKNNKYLCPIPTVIANAAIVPFVIKFAYGSDDSYLFILTGVLAGEIISACVFGTFLYPILKKRSNSLFGQT